MPYTKASVPKLPGAGAAVPKSDRILIFDVEDVKTDVPRVIGETSTAGPFELEDKAKGLSIQASRPSISTGYEHSGEIDAKVFVDKVEFDYPGDNEAVNNFIEAYANKGVIIIVQSCAGATKIYGSKCNPLHLQAEPTDNNEARRTHLTFTQEMGDAFVPRVYTGTIPEVEADANLNQEGE